MCDHDGERVRVPRSSTRFDGVSDDQRRDAMRFSGYRRTVVAIGVVAMVASACGSSSKSTSAPTTTTGTSGTTATTAAKGATLTASAPGVTPTTITIGFLNDATGVAASDSSDSLGAAEARVDLQ